MTTTTDDTTVPTYDAYPLDIRALSILVSVGVVAGFLGWLLYLGIAHFAIDPLFCRSADSFAVCRNGGTIAWAVSHLLVLSAAVAVLARFAVYRPLLVILGVFVALWGAHSWLGSMTWYAGALWQALLFGIAFAGFGWLSRVGNFVVALILTLLLAIGARVLLILS